MKRKWTISLLIFAFSVCVSFTVLPCGLILSYGLFGENTSCVVTKEETSNIQIKKQLTENRKAVKGENTYNIWFGIWISIILIVLIKYCLKLPRGETIITDKVRMNN